MQIASASFLGKRIIIVSGVVRVNNYNIYVINTKLRIFLLKQEIFSTYKLKC